MKRIIIDEALLVLVNIVIIPHSGWDPNGPGNDTHWTTVLRNSSGILRYVKYFYGGFKVLEARGKWGGITDNIDKSIITVLGDRAHLFTGSRSMTKSFNF